MLTAAIRPLCGTLSFEENLMKAIVHIEYGRWWNLIGTRQNPTRLVCFTKPNDRIPMRLQIPRNLRTYAHIYSVHNAVIMSHFHRSIIKKGKFAYRLFYKLHQFIHQTRNHSCSQHTTLSDRISSTIFTCSSIHFPHAFLMRLLM